MYTLLTSLYTALFYRECKVWRRVSYLDLSATLARAPLQATRLLITASMTPSSHLVLASLWSYTSCFVLVCLFLIWHSQHVSGPAKLGLLYSSQEGYCLSSQ